MYMVDYAKGVGFLSMKIVDVVLLGLKFMVHYHNYLLCSVLPEEDLLFRFEDLFITLQVPHSPCEFAGNLHLDSTQSDVLTIGAVTTMMSQPEVKGRSLPPVRVSSPPAVPMDTSDSEEPMEQSRPSTSHTQRDEPDCSGAGFGTFIEYVLRLRHKLKSKCIPNCFTGGNVYDMGQQVERSLPRKEDKLEISSEGRTSNEDFTVPNAQNTNGPSRSKKHHRATSMRTRCSMIEEHFSQIHQHAGAQGPHRRCLSMDDAVVFVVVSPHSSAKSLNQKFMDTLVLKDVSHKSSLVARQHQYPRVRSFQIDTV